MVDCWLSAQAAFSSGRLPSLPLFPSLPLCSSISRPSFFSTPIWLSLSLPLSLPLRARSDGEATDHVGWRLERWLLHCRRGSNEGREEGRGRPPARADKDVEVAKPPKGPTGMQGRKFSKTASPFAAKTIEGHTHNQISMQWHIIRTLIAPIYEFPPSSNVQD